MNFKELIFAAQKGDANAFETIFAMYRPLLMKESIICGVFDEDLFQEQCIVLSRCIMLFRSKKRAGAENRSCLTYLFLNIDKVSVIACMSLSSNGTPFCFCVVFLLLASGSVSVFLSLPSI